MEKNTSKKNTSNDLVNNEIILEELRVLNQGIRNADSRLEKFSRPSRIFLRGVLAGLGGAVGASIIAGLIFFIVSSIFNFFNIPLELKTENNNYRQAQIVSIPGFY